MLATIGGVAGILAGVDANSGFTLASNDKVIVTIQSSSANVKAIITSLRIYQ